MEIARDKKAGYYIRSEAMRLLAPKHTPAFMLEDFFVASGELEQWEAALLLEQAGGPDVVAPLIAALQDADLIRRQCAVRAIGWNRHSGPRGAKALVALLNDHEQPQPVRSEACESLAYLLWRQAIPTLVAASKEPDVKIRFWAAFGLGGMRHRLTGALDPRAISRLEEMLDDTGVCPGWWSVGQEALDMLASSNPRYYQLACEQKQAIRANPEASIEDRRWARSES